MTLRPRGIPIPRKIGDIITCIGSMAWQLERGRRRGGICFHAITEQKESSMDVLVTVVLLSVGFLAGYVVAIAVYDRVTLEA